MNTINIGPLENNVVLKFNDKNNKVIDLTSYKDYLDGILLKTSFKGDPAESYFAYLINLIVTNNLAEMILDQAHHLDCPHIVVETTDATLNSKSLKLNGYVDQFDLIGNVGARLLASDEYISGQLTVDHLDGKTKGSVAVEDFEMLGIEAILAVQPEPVRNLKQQLTDDLIAFQFVKKTNTNADGRFILPVYVDESLGFDNQQNIQGWASIHYLQMLGKIHDFFIQRYEPGGLKGFQNDDLMVALIDLVDYKLSPYPTGLQKSVEVGRATAGKSAFITGPPIAFPIPEEIMITLQAKDALGVVPRIRRSPSKGV